MWGGEQYSYYILFSPGADDSIVWSEFFHVRNVYKNQGTYFREKKKKL